MESKTALSTYTFIKETDGRWYIQLPDWKGHKADLEMVEGADKMLDYVGDGNTKVLLQLSESDFEGSTPLNLLHDYTNQTGGGGIYFLKEFKGKTLNQEMWLCEVTAHVFGKLPTVIYFDKVN